MWCITLQLYSVAYQQSDHILFIHVFVIHIFYCRQSDFFLQFNKGKPTKNIHTRNLSEAYINLDPKELVTSLLS